MSLRLILLVLRKKACSVICGCFLVIKHCLNCLCVRLHIDRSLLHLNPHFIQLSFFIPSYTYVTVFNLPALKESPPCVFGASLLSTSKENTCWKEKRLSNQSIENSFLKKKKMNEFCKKKIQNNMKTAGNNV